MAAANLVVDIDRCTGHGRCYTVSSDLLAEDEEGFVAVRHQSMELTEEQTAAARLAVDACPEQAMRIEYGEQ